MRRFVVSLLVLSGAAIAPALAADLPVPAAPPIVSAPYIPAPPPFTWTGFYVGINGGYGWSNWSDGFGDSFNGNGFLGGGELGFNYQIGQFVIGFEGDGDWSGIKWSQSASTTFNVFGPVVIGTTISNQEELLGTFAARFGFAADRILFYGKAGGAWTDEVWKVSITGPGGSAGGTTDISRFGWMAGAGVEYAITDSLTFKAEYNYLGFGNNTDNISIAGGGAVATVAVPSKLNLSVVKLGLNYLFH